MILKRSSENIESLKESTFPVQRGAQHTFNRILSKTVGSLLLTVLSFCALQAQVLGWQAFNTTNSGMPDNRVYAVHTDTSTSHLWVGTDNGLARFDGSTWTSWNTSNSGLPNNSVRSLLADGEGGIWIGTFAGGLCHFDGSVWEVWNTSNSPLPDLYVRSLAPDLLGGLWVGTTAGLVHWRDTTWQVYTVLNSDLHSNNMECMFAPRPDTLWVGTVNGGLTYIEGEDWTDHRIITTGIGDNSIAGVWEDGKGRAWIATPAGGMNEWAGTWIKWNVTNSSLTTNSLTSLDVDSSGYFWMGSTDRGLIHKNAVHLFTEVAGPDSFVRCIDYDPLANVLWVGTNDSGVVRYTLPPVGVEEALTAQDWAVYPNPSTGPVWVESALTGEVRVVDMMGKVLLERSKAEEILPLDMSNFVGQMVLLEFEEKSGQVARKPLVLLGAD